MARHPLSERERPISSDIALAIHQIIGSDEAALPIAIMKYEIVEKLIDIAHMSEDGLPDRVPIPAAKKAMFDSWNNLLSTSSIFQSGYKHYEATPFFGSFPVVPVTDYFFRVICGDSAVCDVLDGMSEFEITQSLPKRRNRVRVENGEGDDFERDDNGEVIQFGLLAGIVVFPPKSDCMLLDRWLRRLSNVVLGNAYRAVKSIGHSWPDRPAVAKLENMVGGLKPLLSQSLPRSKGPV
jgi:hypothetical protein